MIGARRAYVVAPVKLEPQSVSVPTPPKNDPDLEKLLADIEADDRALKDAYAQYVANIRELPGEQRAEAWLKFKAEHATGFPDAEALVYLISQGKARQESIDDLWHHGAVRPTMPRSSIRSLSCCTILRRVSRMRSEQVFLSLRGPCHSM